MDVVTGALTAVLGKLGDLLIGEFQLQASIRDEISSLIDELEWMHAALLKISEAPIDNPPDDQDKLWARDVRELSYDVDDCIDKFMLNINVDTNEPKKELNGLMGFINRGINLLKRAKIRHDISADINGIKRRIKEISERRVRYKVDHIASKAARPTVDNVRLSALYKTAAELVGTEERSEDLIKTLMEGYEESVKQKPKIVSIVGSGGLGKTTLAKIVYEKLNGQFDCAAFVSVSNTPTMTNIFRNLLYQLGNHKDYQIASDEAQLIDELKEFLRQKRFFIVIDDIWDDSVWTTIHYGFNENECASIIVTTTRILEVAKLASYIYELKPLSAIDSRKLFYLRVCGYDEKCHSKELPDVAENILKKCAGVPLAIITIASMLASKTGREISHEYWSKVYESMGSGMQDSRDVKDMRRILSVSYYDLPPHLRICLLFLSSYPEDYPIEIQDLILKWVGEGFVQNAQGKALYEVGEDYVDELINRSLIQPEYRFNKPKASHFYVHDMVLDLITWFSNEAHFITKLGHHKPKSVPNKIRRLSIQTNNDQVKLLPVMNLSHVRSLSVFSGALSFLSVLSTFPLLRVLDLKDRKEVGNHHFKNICSLFHLRYLGLYGTSITEVPQEIGDLKFLQILDIDATQVVALPASFVQLRQLVCLRFNQLASIPEGFENIKSLQEFIGLICLTSPTMLVILGQLTKLRSLRIFFYAWDKSYASAFRQLLSSMVNLQDLLIYSKDHIDFDPLCDTNKSPVEAQELRVMTIYNAIPSVPRWMSSLYSLSILSITLQRLGEEDLQSLGSMKSLSHLDIAVRAPTQRRVKKLVVSNDYSFSCLTKLEIDCGVMEVMFAPGAMKNLQKIDLKFDVHKTISQFGDVDFYLENLPSVNHVFVKMYGSYVYPEEVEAAEASIKKTVDKNPNNPTLELKKTYVLELEIHGRGNQKKAQKIIGHHMDGSWQQYLDPNLGKVDVYGTNLVNLTTVVMKLEEAGVPAKLRP